MIKSFKFLSAKTRTEKTARRGGVLRPCAVLATVLAMLPAAFFFTARAEAEENNPAVLARAFLDTLDEEMRGSALFPNISDPLRENWSNLPANLVDVERNGVRRGDLSDAQRRALKSFLQSSLSADGVRTIYGVVGAEAVLEETRRAERMGWADENYWIAFFGEPSEDGAWGWQFGGHHLAVNVGIIRGKYSLSPTFIGVEPSEYKENGKLVRPLQDKLEAGVKLINALSAAQQEEAKTDSRPREVYAGAGKDGVIPPEEGILASGLSAAQRGKLLALISRWIGALPEAPKKSRLAEIVAELDGIRFAWNGDKNGKDKIYFRVQGPSLIIEFSTEGKVGADGGHFHSVYRNPKNEYGLGERGLDS